MKIFKYILVYLIFSVGLYSCTEDLNVTPIDDDITTSDQAYNTLSDYTSGIAKVYASLAVTGQSGPAGAPDISGIDEGFSAYTRVLWKAQVLTTDEAVIAWADGNLPALSNQNWNPNNEFISALYNRIYFSIGLANEFIRESTPEKLSARGITGADAETVAQYQAEARFIRALMYYNALDLYRNVPFVTEEDPVGLFYPEQVAPQTIFDYVESELLAIEELMLAPSGMYGRADQAAVWMLLSRLYLNADVYVGQPRYIDVITYSEKVLNAGYTLQNDYDHLFYADNDTSPEIIFPVVFEGNQIRTFGGTTFLGHAALGGSMVPSDFGFDFGWGGLKTTAALVDKFPFPGGDTTAESPDDRANFWTDGQTKEIDFVTGDWADGGGYGIVKYVNINQDGTPGSNVTFSDTDFPMFRLGEAYLNYAEAVVRDGGGSAATAVDLINELRVRSYGDNSGNISSTDLTLDFIIDERAREMYWEGTRRTDLIRFSSFSDSNYLWPWKGGVASGVSTSSHLDIFPIPAAEIIANPSITQNPGY